MRQGVALAALILIAFALASFNYNDATISDSVEYTNGASEVWANKSPSETFSSHSECKDALLSSMLSIQGRHNAKCMIVAEKNNFASAVCNSDNAVMTIRCDGKVMRTSSYIKNTQAKNNRHNLTVPPGKATPAV